MRSGAVAALVLVATVAGVTHAQPGAPAGGTAMETYRVEAREAALRGDCTQVGTIARLVADVDAAYYRDVFLRDTVVASCNGGVGGVQLPPSATAPTAEAPRAVAPAPGRGVRAEVGLTDTGRGMLGFFAGLGGGALAGYAGAIVGAHVGELREPDCSSFCDDILVPAIIGAQVGMSFGLALSITLVGNHEGGKGSFVTSMGLGLAGSAATWVLALNDETVDNGVFAVAFFVLPVAGTMTGYWLTHKHTPADITLVPTTNGAAVMGRF